MYRAADVMVVTPLRDGMNLVAKEFCASRTDEDGVLVLSRFAGAARQLTSALLVNPFSVDEMGEALRCALTMPREERRCRMRALRSAVRENNIYTWAVNVMSTLLEVGQIPNLSAGLAAQEVAPAAVNF